LAHFQLVCQDLTPICYQATVWALEKLYHFVTHKTYTEIIRHLKPLDILAFQALQLSKRSFRDWNTSRRVVRDRDHWLANARFWDHPHREERSFSRCGLLTRLCMMPTDVGWNAGRSQMRLFSHFALQTARMLALLLLALTFASPASSQTKAPDETIQFIAQQQNFISQIQKMERFGEGVMYLETLALLAAYGDWTRYDTSETMGTKRIENLKLEEMAGALESHIVHAMTAVQRNKSVSEDDLKRFSDIYENINTLCAVANDVYVLLEESEVSKIDEANALYRDKSIPLINSIRADSYTLTSSLEDKIAKAALQSRIAK
jgi:hypothetical protein